MNGDMKQGLIFVKTLFIRHLGFGFHILVFSDRFCIFWDFSVWNYYFVYIALLVSGE